MSLQKYEFNQITIPSDLRNSAGMVKSFVWWQNESLIEHQAHISFPALVVE